MPLQHIDLLVGLRLPDANGCVVRAGREGDAVWRPCDHPNGLGMSLEHTQLVTLIDVPDGDAAIATAADEAPAVGGECKMLDDVDVGFPLAEGGIALPYFPKNDSGVF